MSPCFTSANRINCREMNVALVVSIVLSTQSGQLGKSDAQILKMGRQLWGDYYAEKAGSSTVDMCTSERIYGEVLKRRNDRLISKASRSTKAVVKSLRKDMIQYMSGVYDVGMALSGGGTMWNIVYAGCQPDTEEVVGHILGVKSPKVKARKVSDVTTALKELRDKVAKERKSIEEMPSGGGMKSALNGLDAAESALPKLISVAARRPRGDSDAILSCCLACIADLKEFLGEGE